MSERVFGVDRKDDPPTVHQMRLPMSLKNRIKKAGNMKVLKILNENLPTIDSDKKQY